jgi:SAM-dependent methyltransferase
MASRASVRDSVKATLTRWPAAKAAAYVADDLHWGARRRLGRIHSESGSTHLHVSAEESVRYVEAVFGDYRHYGGSSRYTGVAADVGPGDNAAVALLLRAAGCDQVDLIDRFRSRRDLAQQQKIYELLSSRHDVDRYRHGTGWDDSRLRGISWNLGVSAEQFFARQAARGPRYDLIVSRAALEHLYDPLAAIRSMAACLMPGGRMVHKIDLRDHGMFTPAHHELTFLRYPSPLYRQMTRFSGRPNRVMFDRYRALAQQMTSPGALGLQADLLVTSLVGQPDEVVPHVHFDELPAARLRQAVTHVESERPRLSGEFDGVSSQNLAVSGLFFVAVRS